MYADFHYTIHNMLPNVHKIIIITRFFFSFVKEITSIFLPVKYENPRKSHTECITAYTKI